MKTLSDKQPWAYLLCAGIKGFENRTWKLPEKYKGEWILIHAGANPAKIQFEIKGQASVHEIYLSSALNKCDEEDMYSCIIGAVKFSECIINSNSIWAEKSEGNCKQIYNWKVSDSILFDKPILGIKGKLSFWDFDLPEEYQKLLQL